MSWSIPLLFARHRRSHLEKASVTGLKALCKMQFNLKWLRKQQSSCSLTETQGDTNTEMCFCFLYFTDKNLSQKRRVQWTMSTWSLWPKVLLILKYVKWRPWTLASMLSHIAKVSTKCVQFCVPFSCGKGSKEEAKRINNKTKLRNWHSAVEVSYNLCI